MCMVKHDDYMTPFSAWEDVSAYIPRHLTLWEAFYGDGTPGLQRSRWQGGVFFLRRLRTLTLASGSSESDGGRETGRGGGRGISDGETRVRV